MNNNLKVAAICCALSLSTISLTAQEWIPIGPQPQQKQASSQTDHWYISLDGGAGFAFCDDDYNTFDDFSNSIGYNAKFTVGYYINKLWGVRFQGGLMKMHSRINRESYEYLSYANPDVVPNKGFYGYNVLQGTAEVTLNLTRLFYPYLDSTPWNWYIFAGPGATMAMNYEDVVEQWRNLPNGAYDVNSDSHLMWNLNGGIALKHHFAPRWAFNCELECSLTGDQLEGVESEEFYDAIINLSIGLTYCF